MNTRAKEIIEKLNLLPHPEGGYYKEIYRSNEQITKLSDRYSGERAFATSIYFLLNEDQKSNFHKLKSDELWYYHEGSSLSVYIINEEGILKTFKLGLDLDNDELPQLTIHKNSWFAAEVNYKTSFCLMGCMVSPGFDFSDFELGKREELLEKFPEHSGLIRNFTDH